MSSKEHKTPNEQVSDELNQGQALHTEAETGRQTSLTRATSVLQNLKPS